MMLVYKLPEFGVLYLINLHTCSVMIMNNVNM